MTDREKDFALLASFGGGYQVSAVTMGFSVGCTVVTIALAFYSSAFLGNSTLILVALLMTFSSFFVLIQRAVSGPLVREVKRLRAELDELKSQRDAT